MIKYNADREITNIYENLQIVWSQFVTDMLLLVYIRSTSNIYWFISIRICCQRIHTNSYSVTFDIHTIRSGIQWTYPKVKKQLFAVTYCHPFAIKCHPREQKDLPRQRSIRWPLACRRARCSHSAWSPPCARSSAQCWKRK